MGEGGGRKGGREGCLYWGRVWRGMEGYVGVGGGTEDDRVAE